MIQPDSVKGFESWESPETMPVAKSHLLHYVVTTIFVGLIIELTAYLAIQFILFPREPAFFFRSPSVSATEFDRYVTVRDSLLGWPAKKTDMNGTEVIESRPIPAYSSSEN